MFLLVLYPPPLILRLNIAYFAVAEGWLLLDIGWFVLFLLVKSVTYTGLLFEPRQAKWALHGQRASGKRAYSFWRLIPWNQLELLVCLQSWQTGKEFRLHWHSFVRVQIYYKYWLSINRTNTRYNSNSFIARWLAHWPLESGIVSSNPAISIFLRIKLFSFISLSFLFFSILK